MRPKLVRIERGIFVLRLNVSEAHLNGGKLIAADAPAQDLIEPGPGVEAPFLVLAHERDGERPVIVADDERRLVFALVLNRVLLVVGGDKILARPVVRDLVAGADDLLPLRPEDLVDGALVMLLGCGDQRRYRVIGAVELLLRGSWRANEERGSKDERSP